MIFDVSSNSVLNNHQIGPYRRYIALAIVPSWGEIALLLHGTTVAAATQPVPLTTARGTFGTLQVTAWQLLPAIQSKSNPIAIQ